MKLSDLESLFIEELEAYMSEWTYVKSQRKFKKIVKGNTWYFHINCIKHVSDFDVVGDVAIEFKAKKERICIVGAELGNISGVGQKRFSVASESQAKESALEIYKYFEEHGCKFCRKYSEPHNVINTLKNGGKEALLISPFVSNHKEQIISLTNHIKISM
ncbi:hypothetical protein [Photobacterium swingsii]|uniref:hypothetical protein n=1 Tax=Photobacterium swingsii TaxID=680026 RepID=UPI003D1160CC